MSSAECLFFLLVALLSSACAGAVGPELAQPLLTHRIGVPPAPYRSGLPKLDGYSTYVEAREFLGKLQTKYETEISKKFSNMEKSKSACNASNVAIRRAWDDISENDRRDYIRAVKCMAQKPSRTNSTSVPGARNWIDDYVWQHISVTNIIHVSGLLLPWHRQFIWSWEQSLRRDCNYKGYLPYWPWERHADNQSQSPVWQSNSNSFGTNGEYIPHGEIFEPFLHLPQPLNFSRAAGTGGGCVSDGAFGVESGWLLNIGPLTPINNTVFGTHNTITPNNTWGQQYNPRCLKRDWLQAESTTLLNYTQIAKLMMQESIHTFHPMLENNGVHLGGHFFIGGDGSDIYASPNDPVFFLHHANIDRLWSIWQGQDFESRGEALDGTVTIADIPPSHNATLKTVMDMGIPAGGDIEIWRAMDTTGNDYCYMYI